MVLMVSNIKYGVVVGMSEVCGGGGGQRQRAVVRRMRRRGQEVEGVVDASWSRNEW